VALRVASHANDAAARPRLPGNLGSDGISLDRRGGNWTAQINQHGRGYFLGRYPTVQEAHEAYAMAVRLLPPRICTAARADKPAQPTGTTPASLASVMSP
jgi:hypothetical protein